jgi:thioester reductase-like protein
MSYFVTGATGFVGRHLVERLLARGGDIHVLVRPGSTEKLEALATGKWAAVDPEAAERIHPVVGDLAAPRLGDCDETVAALTGKVDHYFPRWRTSAPGCSQTMPPSTSSSTTRSCAHR